jgi:hypothetical protein
MPKYRHRAIPKIDTANIYAEGKRAFSEGQQRGHNPYRATNLALAAIWWNGWDTGEEEREAKQKPQRQSALKVLHRPLKGKS